MITPDAKCIVNGEKVNEAIYELNKLLSMSIMVGTSDTPQVKFGSGSVQIILPPSGGADTNELLDVVDSNNTASSRWFLTTDAVGAGGAGGGGVNNITPQNNSQAAPANKKRNQLNAGGGQGAGGGGAGAAGADREKLQNRGAAGGASGASAGSASGDAARKAAERSGQEVGRPTRSAAERERMVADGGTARNEKGINTKTKKPASMYNTGGKTAGDGNDKFQSRAERIQHEKRQAAADDMAAQNKFIWQHAAKGQKSKGTQHYAKYAHKKKHNIRYD